MTVFAEPYALPFALPQTLSTYRMYNGDLSTSTNWQCLYTGLIFMKTGEMR